MEQEQVIAVHPNTPYIYNALSSTHTLKYGDQSRTNLVQSILSLFCLIHMSNEHKILSPKKTKQFQLSTI